MTKSLLSTRVACSVYSKSLNFTERNSVKYLILPRQALADVCNIDVLNDFAKFAGKHLYKILQDPACSFIAVETPMKMFYSKFCGIFKNIFFKDLFWTTSR